MAREFSVGERVELVYPLNDGSEVVQEIEILGGPNGVGQWQIGVIQEGPANGFKVGSPGWPHWEFDHKMRRKSR